jgi:hypothetical protein
MSPRDRHRAEVIDNIVMALFLFVMLAIFAGMFGD